MIRHVKERLLHALENANLTTQQIIALKADEFKQGDLEEWLDQLRIEEEDSVDKVEEDLERRVEAPLLVTGDFATDYASEVEEKTSQTSESSDVPQALKAAEMLKADVASLQEEEKKRGLQEELKLRYRTAQIKVLQ